MLSYLKCRTKGSKAVSLSKSPSFSSCCRSGVFKEDWTIFGNNAGEYCKPISASVIYKYANKEYKYIHKYTSQKCKMFVKNL